MFCGICNRYEMVNKSVHVLHLLVVFVKSIEIRQQALRSIVNPDYDNVAIIEPNLGFVVTRSPIDCLSECGANKKCLSYQYESISKQCRLYDKDFINPQLTKLMPGNDWRYHYLIKGCTLSIDDCPQQNGFIYNAKTCFCFRVGSTQFTQPEAANMCAKHNTSLVRIDRGWKELLVRNYLESNNEFGDVFIQGKRDLDAFIYRYDDGTIIKYFNWDVKGGEPDEKSNTIFIRMKRGAEYLWYDTPISGDNQFVCQIE